MTEDIVQSLYAYELIKIDEQEALERASNERLITLAAHSRRGSVRRAWSAVHRRARPSRTSRPIVPSTLR
jgi:hypothetical protein